MNIRFLAFVVLVFTTTTAFGQRGNPTVAQMREWLQRNVVNQQGPATYQQAQRSLNQLPDDQVQGQYRRYLLLAQQRLAQLQAYRNQLLRQRGGVGFAPVVTWLPQGATMNVGAVVSPDRRYVRINAQPFFSSIPRVDTFTYAHPSQGFGTPGFGSQGFGGFNVIPQQQQVQQNNAPRIWYDGLRTRVGRR